MSDRGRCYDFGAAYCTVCKGPGYHHDWLPHDHGIISPCTLYTRDEEGTIWTTVGAGCRLVDNLKNIVYSKLAPRETHGDIITECERYWERVSNPVPPSAPRAATLPRLSS